MPAAGNSQVKTNVKQPVKAAEQTTATRYCMEQSILIFAKTNHTS